MDAARAKRDARTRRHRRVRRKVVGTAERPRLAVFRSNKYIYAQVIDDTTGRTLAAAGPAHVTVEGTKTDVARAVGAEIARRAREAGITRVVFDRGGYLYHGRVAALAEAARSNGMEF